MKVGDFYKINEFQEKQFAEYMDLLIDWNAKINLTSITDKDEIIIKHFIDSITINKYIGKNSKVIDVGTGAGFPGIPIKIYDDSLNVTLLDSLNKRINFLNEVINNLELEKIEAIHGRAEDVARDSKYRENYDYVTSRAVANLSTLLEYVMPFIKIGGKCICMKGPNIYDELDNAKNAINTLGGKVEKIEEFLLPNTDIKRSIVIIKKVGKTSDKYPRNAGIPAKKPL